MVLQVYLDPCTINCRKVLAGLEHLNSPFDLHHIDYFKGEHKSAEYMKINPSATVPAATDGDLVITESNAILQYAAAVAGNTTAYPDDVKTRAAISSWQLWEASAWFPSCYVYVVEYVVKPLLKSSPDESIITKEAPRFHKLATALEIQLAKTKWIVGNEPTIADFSIAAPMHLHEAARLPLQKYPNVQRWYAQVAALPAWQNTQQAVDKALLPNKKVASTTSTSSSTSSSSSSSVANGTPLNGVRTKVNYTKDVSPKLTELYFYESPSAASIHEPGDDPREITVHDGWPHATTFHIDKHGFSLHDFPSRYHHSWEDDDQVRQHFYPEVVSFIQKTTGASRVLVFDHTIRTARNQAKKLTQETHTSQRAPVMLVHCDYTAESGPLRVKQLLPAEEAAHLLARRVAFLNVWKPLAVVEERPLAMCDVQSSPGEDFFKLHLRYRDRDGENYVMRYNEGHRWWYFPRMPAEKVILLKTFDSEVDGRARFVGHTAFEDPSSGVDARVRESVEIRTIAFF